MPLEFPAVSQSRVSLWGQPQYTQRGMLLFTVLFGFFGLHHFYLRSPQTGLMILLANIFTLGYPYFFDIIQLATKPFDELQSKGLDLPWSVAGIAQGMWIKPEEQTQESSAPVPSAPSANTVVNAKPAPSAPQANNNNPSAPSAPPAATNTKSSAPSAPQANNNNPSAPSAPPAATNTKSSAPSPSEQTNTSNNNPKSYEQEGGADVNAPTGPPAPHWFLLYSLLLPLTPLARYVAGDTDNALLGLLNLTIIPLGFLFTAVAILSEYWTLFMKPSDLLTNGIYRTFPFTSFGYSETGYSPRLTGHIAEEPTCEDDVFLIRIFKGVYRSVLPAWLVALIDQAVATKTQVVDRAINTAQKVKEKVDVAVETGTKVAKLATEIPGAIQGAQQQIQSKVNAAASAAKAASAALPPIQSFAQLKQKEAAMNSAAQPANTGQPVNTANPITTAQTGGGFVSDLTQTDKVVAGGLLAVILSGFVIHTGRSAWNAIQDVRSATDLPPHASFHA